MLDRLDLDAVESIFLDAAALPPSDRPAFLSAACGSDPALRREVESLLLADAHAGGAAAHAGDAGMPDRIAACIAEAAAALTEDVADGREGERVGAYRLVRELGHGGMGTVYHAERADDEYRARVAIKFVRGAFAVPELARRFRAERQILADLRHPSIARLLDGGATADGTPYLVMEYLDGVAIDVWCDANALDVRARVALFLPVCAAIGYAHRARVVHSDIKPSNILVEPDGTPKVVDFGIAKLLDPEPGAETTLLRPLTPAFASPEQRAGDAITASTDVYALGAVLYHLLTGRAPSSGQTRTVPPSEAASRRDEAWRDHLAEGLDAVVMRALATRPADRFTSPDEFAEALRACLDRQASPRAIAMARHLRRRVRAHRRFSAAVVLGVVSVLLFAGHLARVRQRDQPLRFDYHTHVLTEDPVPRPYGYVVADMTGDGRADLVFSHMAGDTNVTRVAAANARGGFDLMPLFRHPHTPPEGWNERYALLTGDFDGDGRQDLLWNAFGGAMPNRAIVAFGQEDGFRYMDGVTLGPTRWSDSWTVQVADVNGDRADDLVFNVLTNRMNTLIVALSNRNGTFDADHRFAHRSANWLGYHTFIADVDGDGLNDVVWNGPLASGNRTYVARSRGAGNFDLLSYKDDAGDWSGYSAQAGDVNGDGRADLVWADTSGARPLRTAFGTGEATFVMQGAASPDSSGMRPVLVGRFTQSRRSRIAWLPQAAPADARAADVNGDGFQDIIWHDPATRITTVGLSIIR